MTRLLQKDRGFTLIEMMVVLLVIGILVSTIVISVKTDDLEEHMEIEMQRLQALITLAREEAILQGYDMALALKEDKYLFQWYDTQEQKWLPVDDGQVFRERAILPGTEMVLVIEDLPQEKTTSRPGLSLNDDDKESEEQEDDIQRVVIFPSGEVFPFELILRKEDASRQFKLIANEQGDIVVQHPDEFG